MTYKRTQKRNPHQLTIRQHIIPQFHIKSFYSVNNTVEFLDVKSNTAQEKTAKDMVFCTKRVWDQRAESGYMKYIEDEFVTLLRDIREQNINALSHEQSTYATNMFCLWSLRHELTQNSVSDQKLYGISGDNLSKDQQEILEKKHVSYITKNAMIPARQFAGLQIQIRIDIMTEAYFNNGSWGIIKAQEGEFIFPDNFDRGILPISPSVCLIFNCEDIAISANDVSAINQLAIKSSQYYYFAKDLSQCPT